MGGVGGGCGYIQKGEECEVVYIVLRYLVLFCVVVYVFWLGVFIKIGRLDNDVMMWVEH